MVSRAWARPQNAAQHFITRLERDSELLAKMNCSKTHKDTIEATVERRNLEASQALQPPIRADSRPVKRVHNGLWLSDIPSDTDSLDENSMNRGTHAGRPMARVTKFDKAKNEQPHHVDGAEGRPVVGG